MSLATVAWLDRPTEKVGLDNLGTQQPCVFLYSRLLPGVTNVTDRAHYFGYYPWFVRAFDARYPKAPDAQFREMLRRGDCLICLVAERHAAVSGDADVDRHGGRCPGRLTLGPAALELAGAGATVKLSEFANRADDNKKRYFKNPLGGLGQYYLGPLRDEYEALRGDARNGIKFTTEVGEPIAENAALGLPEDAFFATLEKDEISVADVDALFAFCPCSLANPERAPAHTTLTTLLLEAATPNGLARRRTFDLMLRFFEAAAGKPAIEGPVADPVREFLHACYAGRLPNGAWGLDQAHEEARVSWALYARNEMMSLAWIAIFKLCLDALEEAPVLVRDVDALCEALLSRDGLAWRPSAAFDALVAQDIAGAPPIDDIIHPEHEFALWRALANSRSPSLADAVQLIVRLVSRFGDEDGSYTRAGVPATALGPYPLTLDTLNDMARRRWRGLDARAWLKALMVEVFVTHQRVAIRKMGQSNEDTLMVRANDLGYFVHRPQEVVVATQPRLRQVTQILRDLDFVAFQAEGLPIVTERGLALLEATAP